MKKIFIFTILTVVAFASFSLPTSFAYAENVFWAKIEKPNTYFYALANEGSEMFILPQSYFVKLTGEVDEFFAAQYLDVSGYVKKEDVSPMDGTPVSPFFTENFRAFLPSGTGLYATSQMQDDYKILDIPYLYENLIYYGSIIGQTAIPDKSNTWHYCKYQDEYGYVYSTFCDKLLSPPINSETFPIIEKPVFNTPSGVESLSSTAMAFIIIGVSLPCLIVLYLLVKPNMMKVSLPREKSKYKGRKRRDYFEFDQTDLN